MLANVGLHQDGQSVYHGDEAELEREVTDWNRQMRGKGIFLQVLRKKEGRALVYVCRFSRLEEDMQKPGTAEFLKQCGYEKAEPAAALDRLRRKLQSEDGFPHEIGLFLGYPLGDVVGFIVNAGRNYALTGYWKVYTNVVSRLPGCLSGTTAAGMCTSGCGSRGAA